MSCFYNHLNSVSGTLLTKKYINACTLSATHVDEFAALSTNVPNKTLTLWASKICAWEVDREQPNLISTLLLVHLTAHSSSLLLILH